MTATIPLRQQFAVYGDETQGVTYLYGTEAEGPLYPNPAPELERTPSAAQLAAAKAATEASGTEHPWIPTPPVFDQLTGPNDMGLNPDQSMGATVSHAWVSASYPLKVNLVDNGAGHFFGTDERTAETLLARAGAPASAQFITVDTYQAGKGKRDRLKVLYMRQGDLMKPVAAVPYYKAGSWVSFRDADLIPIASVALSFVGGPLTQMIGNAVLSPALVAAYPALPGVVGATALNTALNGGDLGAALQSAVLSTVGAQAGALATDATGIKALGAATSAATTAALRGGDVGTAVAQSLLQYGVKNVDFSDLFDGAADFLGNPFGWGADPQLQPIDSFNVTADPNIGPQLPEAGFELPGPVQPATWDLVDWNAPSPGDFTTDASDWAADAPQFGGGSDVSIWPTANTPAPASSSGWDFGDIVADLTTAAMAAIKINQAYQASKLPQPRTAVQSGNVVRTPNADGTLTVRNVQTGQQALTRPEVGTPYVLPDGRTIINNGNGTYTLIGRDGSQQVRQYPAQLPAVPGGGGFSMGSIPPAYLIAGAVGVGALVLLASRRK